MKKLLHRLIFICVKIVSTMQKTRHTPGTKGVTFVIHTHWFLIRACVSLSYESGAA
jgi:hypothetical protein